MTPKRHFEINWPLEKKQDQGFWVQEVLEGYTFLNASVELSSGDQKCTAIIISCSIIFICRLLLIHLQTFISKNWKQQWFTRSMVFYFQNCFDQLWEKNWSSDWENFWNSSNERSEHFFKKNAFLTCSVRYLRSNTLEQL